LGRQNVAASLSDNDLIRLYLKSQDSSYFSIIYRKYADKVFGKCIALLREEALAQDAMQEVFMKIFLNLSNFNEKSQFSTWIYSITYNYCIDLIRKGKKTKNMFTDDMERAAAVPDDVSDSMLMEMEVRKLKVVLEKIPVDDHAILLMKYQDDMSIKDISENLDKTESAVKMKLKRAKEKAVMVYKELYPEN
jgi:RNA polymerase sigma factor (sigma-70 family)